MGSLFGFAFGLLMGVMLVSLVLIILMIVAQWRIFVKAGKPGWAAIIPFYSSYTLFDIVWGNGWLFLLLLIPVGNLVVIVATCFKMAKAYGKGIGFGFGLIFLPVIFLMILAFDSSTYEDPCTMYTSGVIVAAGVVGGVYILITLLSTVFVIPSSINSGTTSKDWNYSVEGNSNKELKDKNKETNKDEDIDKDFTYGGQISEIAGFKPVELDNGTVKIATQMFDNEYTFTTGATTSGSQNGVELQTTLGYSENSDYIAELGSLVASEQEILGSLDFYSEISLDDVISGDGFALQQVNYNYTLSDKVYPCFTIIKVEKCEGYLLTTQVTVDNSSSNENTIDTMKEVCSLYGIDFQFD